MAKSFSEIQKQVQEGKYVANKPTKLKKTKTFAEIQNSLSDYDFGVDKSYIDSFVNDSKKAFKRAANDSTSIDFNNSKNQYNRKYSDFKDLKNRAKTIRAYYNANKEKIDKKSYDSMISFLDGFNKDSDEIVNYYGNKAKEYSKFETEDDYNTSLAPEKYKNYSLKQIEEAIGKMENNNNHAKEVAWLKEYLPKKRIEEKISKQMQVQKNSDFDTVSSNRNFNNPTTKELKKADINASVIDYDGNQFWGNDGKLHNYSELEEYKKKNSYEVPDKLGIYLANTKNRTQPIDWSNVDTQGKDTYSSIIIESENNRWDLLTDNEIAVYYYYLNKGEKEAAYKFLEDMSYQTGLREYAETKATIEEAPILEQIAYNIASVPANVYGGVAAFVDDSIRALNGKEINPYGASHRLTNFANFVRSDTANDINGLTNNLSIPYVGTSFGDVYQFLMSAVDSLAGAKTLGRTYTAFMGMNAASNEAKKLYEQGASNEQIAVGGILSGAAEAIFEYVSLDHFLKADSADTVKKLLVQGLLQAGVEASEEVATEIANTFTNAIVMADKSDWAKFRNKYKEEGYSDASATALALINDVTPNVINAGIGGFISGGAMVGGAMGTDLLNSTLQNHIVNSDVKKATAPIIKQSLIDKGFSEDIAESTSKWMAKGLSGKTLTKGQQNFLAENDAAMEVYSSMVDTNSAVSDATRQVFSSKGVNKEVGEDISAIKEYNSPENIAERMAFNIAVENAIKAENRNILRVGNRISSAENSDTEVDKAISDTIKEGVSVASKNQISNVENKISEDNKVSSEDGATVKKIVSIKDGNMTLELEDGTTVDSNDVVYKSNDDALAYESVLSMGYDVSTANAIVNGYKSTNLPIKDYLLGVNEAYNYGKIGYPQSAIKNDGYYSELTEAQKNFAYNLGKGQAEIETLSAQSKIKKSNLNPSKSGKVHFTSSVSALTDRQKVSISTIGRVVSDITHNEVFVYESVEEDGQRVFKDNVAGHKKGEIAPNGFYDSKTGNIYIDLSAGNNGEGVMLWTMAHELTHFVRQWSPAKFKVLADFLMEEYGKQGVDINALIRSKIENAKKNGRTMSFDTAYEEVVADSMQTMFTDTNLAEKLSKLKTKDETLWQKIKDFFDKLYKNIQEVYKGLNPQSVEGELVREMKDSIEKISDLFAEAVVDAGESFNATDIKTTADNGGVKYSINPEFAQKYDSWDKTNNKQVFIIGTASKILQKIGIENKTITWDSSKILKILNKHLEITDDIIKQVPNILESPIIVMKSNTSESRITMFGEVYADGKPVLAVLELSPNNRKGLKIDEIKVASAYAKDNAQKFIDNSEVLYLEINKKRINTFETLTGLQLPVGGVDSNNIIPTDSEKVKENNIKNSDRDTEYLELAKNPEKNEARLREMVETEAKRAMPNSKLVLDNGKLRTVYHGTNETDFNIFDKKYIGMSSGDSGFFGRGFYFAYTRGEASYYGNKRIIPAYLNITNPFNFETELYTFENERAMTGYSPDIVGFVNIADKLTKIANSTDYALYSYKDGKEYTLAEVSKLYKEIYNTKKFETLEAIDSSGNPRYEIVSDKKTNTFYDAEGKQHSYTDYGYRMRTIRKDMAKVDIVSDYLINKYGFVDIPNVTKIVMGTNFSEELQNLGYDGVIQSEYGDEAVAFNSSQIKSADLVTYDDEGNVIPLSERFNEKNEDIRYSDRDSEGNTLSKGQQEYFKDSKVRDENGNLLVVYHGTFADFSVFDINKTANENIFGKGHYFSSNKNDAKNNYASSNGGDVKTKIEDLAALYFEEMGHDFEDQYDNEYIDDWNKSYDKAEAFYKSGKVMETYLNITNPLYADENENLRDAMGNKKTFKSFESLLEQGFDGIIDKYASSRFKNVESGTTHYIAFNSNQIKETSNLNPTENEDIRYSDRNLYKKQKSVYNEYNSLNMQWAYSSGTKIGEQKIVYNPRTKSYFLIEATKTDVGFIELAAGNQKELKGMLNHYDESRSKHDRWVENTRIGERNNGWDSEYVGYSGKDADNGEFSNRELGKSSDRAGDFAQVGGDSESLNSDRNPDATDNRTLLSNALASTAQNNKERKYIEQYQSKIDSINAEQTKLTELRAKIKEISFSKGKRDMEQLRMLRDEATKSANRINTYDKQLLRLESAKPLKQVIEREKAIATKKAEQKSKETLNAYRNSVEQSQRELMNRYNERVKNIRANRQITEIRHKIKNLYLELNSMINSPKKNRYIPTELLKPVSEILGIIDIDTGRSERISQKLAAFKLKYDAIEKNPKYSVAYDPFISEMISAAHEIIGETPVKDMSRSQLEATYTLSRALMHTVKNAVKVRNIETEQNAFEISMEMKKETDSIDKPKGSRVSKWIQMSLRPEAMFERFANFKKNSMWSKVYQMFDKGQIKMLQIQMESNKIFADILADTDYLESLSDTKNLVDIGLKDDDGTTVKVTRGMMLAIYRALMNEDNERHIMLGGITVPDFIKYYKGKKDAYGIGHKVIHGIASKGLVDINEQINEAKNRKSKAKAENDANAVAIIDEEIEDLENSASELYDKAKIGIDNMRNKISNLLTDKDNAYLSAAHHFFDVYSKEKLNEATMELYGFEKAHIKNYLPIHTDPNFRSATFDMITKDMSLENSGFVKDRVKASNPIMLEDLSDIVNSQINNVSKYCGLTLAIKDFQKIYGKSEKGFAGSLQDTIASKFGKAGKDYISNLLSDLVGSRNTDSTIFDRARSSMAGAVLSINPRVALAQAASYPTAASEIGWEPLVKALKMGLKSADRELIAKYSPLLWYRSQGYSTTEIGDIKNISQTQNKVMRKTNWLMGWIQAIDTATVGRLWYASQFYVDDNFKDLKKGTDEYYEKVAEVFNNVVEKTQPNYTTLQRPDILRNPNAVVKQLTMFMTQRLQNFNIVYESAEKYNKYRSDYAKGINDVTQSDLNDARDSLIRSISSQVVASATIVAMKFLVDVLTHSMNGYRDDDDKELSFESISLSLLDNFTDTMISNIVGGSELYAVLKSVFAGERYYGISLNGVDALTSAIENFINVTQDFSPQNCYKLAETICTALGIPLSNSVKIGKGIYYHIVDIVNGEFGSFEAGVDRTTGQTVSAAFSAYSGGDTQKMKSIIRELTNDKVKSGKTETEAKASVRSSLTSKYKDEYIKYIKSGATDKANEIRKFLYATGMYGTLSELDKTLQKWKDSK